MDEAIMRFWVMQRARRKCAGKGDRMSRIIVTLEKPATNSKINTFNARALINVSLWKYIQHSIPTASIKMTHRLAASGDLSMRVMKPRLCESSCRERNWANSESQGSCLKRDGVFDFMVSRYELSSRSFRENESKRPALWSRISPVLLAVNKEGRSIGMLHI